MYPSRHVFFGAIFCLVILLIFPDISFFYLSLIFFSSFLIDFDHFLAGAYKKKTLNFFAIYKFYTKKDFLGSEKHLHIFHTVEFLFLILFLGLFFPFFLFIFIGMLFHSFLDVISMAYHNRLNEREFFFTNYLIRVFSK